MKTSFSKHGWYRVRDRLSLSPREVADLLDWDLAVDIGVEPGTNRAHRVFFSAPDGMCFVAIQDQVSGEVVTVLPVDFHENIAWPVPVSAQETAWYLASPGEYAARRRRAVPTVAASEAGPRVFRLGAYVRRPHGRWSVVNLGSWPCEPYDRQAANLLEDGEFLCAVKQRLAAKGVDEHDVETVFIRLGQKAVSTIVPVVPGAARRSPAYSSSFGG